MVVVTCTLSEDARNDRGNVDPLIDHAFYKGKIKKPAVLAYLCLGVCYFLV